METGKRAKHNNIVEYNIQGKTEQQYYDNGNNCEITTDSSKREQGNSSVVFEHIVPNTVKKMWVMAESSNDIKQDNKEDNSLQSGQRLKSKYGNFFISHDVAKENTESNAEILKKYKSESVSESPELPHAKNHWGVQLKPVLGDSTNEFLRFNKVSSNQRPLSIAVDDNFMNERKLQSESRSQSLDFLDQIDGNNKDYSTRLTVQQRRKNFENSLTSEQNDEQSDKYAILYTKRPLISSIGDFDLRGKSRLFYQPSKDIIANVAKAKDTEKKNARQPISLEDLLKQDEESLAVDVVEKKRTSHNDTINDSNKCVLVNGNSVISNVGKKSVVQQNENNTLMQKSKPVNEPFNLKNQNVSYRLKKDNKDSDSNTSSRNVKNLISDDNMMNPMNHKLSDLEFYDKNLHNSNVKNEQIIKEQIVKSNSDKNIKHDSYKKGNSTVDRFTKNVKVKNDVISNDHYMGKSPTKKQDEKLTEKMKDLSKETTKEEKDPNQKDFEIKTHNGRQIFENDLSILAISTKEKTFSKNGTSALPKNNQVVEKEIRNDIDVTVIESKNKQVIDPKKQNPVSDIDQNLPVSQPESTLEKVNGKPLESSAQHIPNKKTIQPTQQTPANLSKNSQGIRRKVGKLIIMTGDQRDQQLKELEKIKNGQISASFNLVANIPGTALTFMSNEVADDDEPLPPVPTIIFDNPLPKLKSSLSTKGKKRKFNVSFKQGNLATVYSYPSESSYLDEVDSTGQFHKTEDAVHRERDRLAHDEPVKQEILENVNFVTEGGDFNSFSHEEGGSALLF